MNSRRRFYISDGIFTLEVLPINDHDVEYGWEFDEKKIYYLQLLKTKLIFANDAKTGGLYFDFFYALYNEPLSVCKVFDFIINKTCNGVEELEWQGEFSVTDGDFDLDRCTFSLKPKELNPYTCLEKNKSIEVNILQVPNVAKTRAVLDVNYEFFICSGVGAPLGAACIPPAVVPATWSYFAIDQVSYDDVNFGFFGACVNRLENITIHYREVAVVKCIAGVPQPPFGVGWFIHTNNCGLNNTTKWVRSPLLGNNPAPNIALGYGWFNPNTGLDELPPSPTTSTITISNTPPCEDLFYHWDFTLYLATIGSGVTLTFPISVINNTNSTYVWTLSGLSPNPAIVVSLGNQAEITPLTAGIVLVRLTETHGNAFVSIRDYSFTVIQLVGAVNTITYSLQFIKDTISAGEPSEARTWLPIIVTGAITTGWTYSGSNLNNILGGGNNEVIYDVFPLNVGTTFVFTDIVTGLGPPFLLTIDSQGGTAFQVFPTTARWDMIKNYFPNESFNTATRPFYLSNSGAMINNPFPPYFKDGVFQGGVNNSFGFVSIAGVAIGIAGQTCYAIKEQLDYSSLPFGFPVFKIADSFNQIGFGRVPPLYWGQVVGQVTYVDFDRGRRFFESCEFILSKLPCTQTQIVSDFFEHNPVGDTVGYVAGINYVTGLPNRLTALTISQKSDVMNPISSDPATIGNLTWEKITQLWQITFNCFWFIDSLNRIRVEHISWFNRNLAFDTTVFPSAEFNIAKRKFNFDKAKMPQREKFTFSEQRTVDVEGVDIYYDSPCVNQDVNSNIELNELPFITTDLYYVYQFPAAINPEGFVLFCNNPSNTLQFSVYSEAGFITGLIGANFHIGWANLHNNYHKYNRVLLTGYMNSILTNFITAKKTLQQKGLVIKFCCGDVFNPQDILIKSELGNGIVASATHNTKRGTIIVDLFLPNNF